MIKHQNITSKDDPSSTSNRVKIVRMLTACGRKNFASITGISENTLKLWEEPPQNRGGITKKGALRLVEAVKHWGVNCTLEWLLEGLGPSPTLINSTGYSEPAEEINWGEEECILRDIESFKVNNPNPIVVIVTDGSVLPFYTYGDYVAGCKRSETEIDSLIGALCIIELATETIIRRITEKDQNGKYNLVAINSDKSVVNPTLSSVEILSAAKIIWHRSRERIKNVVD